MASRRLPAPGRQRAPLTVTVAASNLRGVGVPGSGDGTDQDFAPIAMPVIKGSTITWTVPLKAIPKESGVKVGSRVTYLHFRVHVHTIDGPPTGRHPGFPAHQLPVDAGDYNPNGTYTLS